jgi:hypothetical protein
MLTGYVRDGTEYLSASTVRRVVQVASMSVVGSAIAVSRLDKEVRRVTTAKWPSRLEKRAGDRRPRGLPCQGAVARKAEGLADPQGSGLDVRAVREDRQDRRGHLHEGDVRHRQRAVNHPALSRCKAGAEGKRRTDMARPSG